MGLAALVAAAGAGLLVAGVAQIYIPAAFIAAGLLLLAFGLLVLNVDRPSE